MCGKGVRKAREARCATRVDIMKSLRVNGILEPDGKSQSGKARDIPDSRYWKPAAIRGLVMQIYALVGACADVRRQAKIGELTKIERHRRSTDGRNRQADLIRINRNCPPTFGTPADGGGGERRQDPLTHGYNGGIGGRCDRAPLAIGPR